MLDHHGWGDLHAEAQALTKAGLWDDLVADDLLALDLLADAPV